MEEVKVLKLKILPTEEQANSLYQTMLEYTRVCNVVSQWIFDNGFEISHHRVNAAIYHEIRAVSTLTARLVQDTFRTVCAKYQTVKTQLSKVAVKDSEHNICKDSNGKKIYKSLEWLWYPISFKKPQCDLTHGIDYSFVNGGAEVSISTINGRQRMLFQTCSYWERYFDGTWKLGTAKLLYRNKKWYLHIPATREIQDVEKANLTTVVGIDRGLRFLATTYDGSNTFFWSGKQVQHKRDKFAKTRQNLQTHNTRYSRRRLRRIGHRENRWMSHLNHVATKALVEYYGPNTVFVLEDLEGVSFDEKNLRRSKQDKRQLRSWAFYKFEQFLTYKAKANQSEVLTVNPRYTSQRCPVCCVIDKEQRDHEHHEYHCRCGYRSNDDRVGAINIRELGLRWLNGEDKPKFVKARNLEIAL